MTLRFGKTKVAIENYNGAENIDVSHIVISKLIKMKTNSKYLIGYLDEVIRPLVLLLPKMSRYVKTFKVKD